MRTKEGAKAYKNAVNMCVEFFSKAGSLYATPKKKSFYSGETTALDLFVNAFTEDQVTSLKLMLWLRDCRGGAGNRSGMREIIQFLAGTDPKLVSLNMHQIPIYGRWDDLKALFNTPLREEAGQFWAEAIDGGDILAAKWAKREYKPIREALGLSEAEFRKMLASIRKDHIVEHKMCQKQWDKINFEHVPSVAMARYTKAFDKHAHDKFQAYKDAVVKGEAKINSSVLFPHDCVRTSLYGEPQTAELQFDALPNYMEGTDEKIMVICDTSGSMGQTIGGSVLAVHVSMGLSLYCSSRLPEDSPFYKRFIGFCSESKLIDWRKLTFTKALRSRAIFNGAVGSTRIDLALKLILDIAKAKDIPQRLMPTTLLIISDMQFHEGATNYGYNWNTHALDEKESFTEIEKAMRDFDQAGYLRPKILYWNTAGYEGQQATVNDNNIGLISGFSTGILKAVFAGEDFTPAAIMYRALEKYKVSIPTEGGVIEV